MTFKVGKQEFVSISNLKKKTKEAELKKYDANKDNLLDTKEAAKYYADKTGGKSLTSLEDVYKLAGGKQRDTKVVDRQFPLTWAPDWRGDFNVPGVGAGNVRTNRMVDLPKPGNKVAESFNFVVDCNLMNRNFLENDIKSAHIVIAQKDFSPEKGSDIAEQITIPLNVATQDGYVSYDRGGGRHQVPEQKMLTASAELESLRKLAGKSGGLSFYVRIETNDGRTLWINRDGKPAKNFEITENELKARGTP
jgi:hypothetical protein